jgi:acyl-CoA synthetase (AMP-forming)/AMP-acid ligase II
MEETTVAPRPAGLGLAEVQELVSAAVPDRAAIRWRGATTTHGQLTDRTRRLANALLEAGLGAVTERSELEPWECGQDFVGVFSQNRPEYLEALLGACKARCVPCNLNHRYRPAELRQLFATAPPKAIVYEAAFALAVRSALADLPEGVVLVEVGGAAEAAIPRAIPYEELLAGSSAAVPPTTPSPDDCYVVFTGGTTGTPKAVLWRQADAFASALHGAVPAVGDSRHPRDVVVEAIAPTPRVVLPVAPFMHGGGQWTALGALLAGDTVAIQGVVDRLDGADVWATVEAERVKLLFITGNAFAVPLLEELAVRSYDLSSLRVLLTGAVAMTDDVKRSLLEAVPGVRIVETIGASESGTHLRNVAATHPDGAKVFTPSPDTVVLDETLTRCLEPGHPGVGWLARAGRIPLGYLGDPDATRTTFPSIGGVPHSVSGDRARLRADGALEFLGRDSATINTGGEKVFAEEVEAALAASPEVADVVVTGREHPRWGQEVVAIVALHAGASVDADELRARAGEVLARYKVPKQVLFVDAVQRNPIGKPDYAWAGRLAAGTGS